MGDINDDAPPLRSNQMQFYVEGAQRTENNFGAFLRTVRKIVGITQTALGKQIGTPQHYISNLETGYETNPSLVFLQRAAAAMGYTVRIELTPQSEFADRANFTNRKFYERQKTLNRKPRRPRESNRELMEAYMRTFLINNARCHICGKRFSRDDPPTLDHIIPAARDGAHDLSNVGPAHKNCNVVKRANLTHLI